MTTISLASLIVAITIGLYLIYIGLRQRRRIPGLGLLHAALAIAGLALLFSQIFTGPTDKMNNFAALFLVLATVGGAMVFALREENKPPSMTMVTVHAIMGVIGTSILIARYFSL